MKKIFLLIVLGGNGYCFLQAQDLYGYVWEQNSGKKPVVGVMIKSTFGANQKTTTAKGDYMLNFQDARPGKSVMLSVEKENWVITDKDKLQAVLPEDPLHHPHIIVLCRRDIWEKQNKDFKALLEKYIKTSYDREKAALDKQDKQYQVIIDSLQDKYAGLEKNLNELAEIYTNTNLDEVSETERKAYLLFQEGKIDESIALRKSFDSENNFKNAKEKQKQLDSLNRKLDTARTATQNEIDFHKRNLREEAQLAKLKYDFATAEEKLGFLAINDSTDFDNLFDYAYFFYYLKKYDKALFWYNKALPMAPGKVEKANVENELGGLYNELNDYEQATKYYADALSIFKELAADDPDTYTTNVALMLANTGLLELCKNNYPAAEKNMQEALKISRKLTKSDPLRNEDDLAGMLLSLGSLHDDMNNYAVAMKEMQEALAIYTRLARDNSTFQSHIATTLLSIGVVYNHQNNYPETEKAYLESIRLRRELVKNNPGTYEPDLVSALNNIGDLYARHNEFTRAEKVLQESYKIIKRLVISYPASYNPKLAIVLENLGNLYLLWKKYPEATNAYLEGLAIRRKLSAGNPEIYEPDIALTLSNLGKLYQETDNYPEAEKVLLESLEIRRRFAKANPDKYDPELASSLNNLGAMYTGIKDYPASEKAYLESLEIRKRLASQNPDAFEPELASLYMNIGLLYKSEKQFRAAVQSFTRSIHSFDRCLAINASEYELSYCRVVILLGDMYLEYLIDDDISEYSVYSRKADSILAKYPADNEWKPLKQMMNKSLDNPLAKKMNVLRVKIEDQQRTAQEKIDLQEQVIKIGKQLSEKEPNLYALDLANELGNLSWDLLMEKEFAKAENAARDALTPSFKNLPAGYADETKWINTNLAAALLFQNKYEEAEKLYRLLKNQKKAGREDTYKENLLSDLDEFEKAGITNPNVEKIRALLKQP